MIASRYLDGKFEVKTSSPYEDDTVPIIEIVKSSNGEAIPEDEPVFLFRARDRLALKVLEAYRVFCEIDGCTDFHLQGIDSAIRQFQAFRDTHPTCMKQPGITRGK